MPINSKPLQGQSTYGPVFSTWEGSTMQATTRANWAIRHGF